jgi:signal transduction histidine kinase
MRKVALVFVLAVFAPSLVLAWLAVRSLCDQQLVLERQQSLLYQGVTDSFARQVSALLNQQQHAFGLQAEELLANNQFPANDRDRDMAVFFGERLRRNWPLAQVGFVVESGILTCSDGPDARTFRRDNGKFLTGNETAEIYWNSKQAANFQSVLTNTQDLAADPSRQKDGPTFSNYLANNSGLKGYTLKNPQTRNIFPQKADLTELPQAQQQLSKVAPAEAEFQQLIGEASEGTLARFVDNRLNVLFWYRSPRDPRYIFGAQLDLARLKQELNGLVQTLEPSLRQDISLAILDDSAKPAAVSQPDFQCIWKRPFVATEIGETLPHWEVAAYLLNPARLSQSAQTIKVTLALIVTLLVLAIGIASWLLVRDINRKLKLARQKSDFVSNVSHELKTPLTSIRMFSELLAEGRVDDPARQKSYLHIITAETARLTRLINNVLDFSRMERGEKKYDFRDCDLAAVARETAETYRPHLETNGFKLHCDLPGSALPVRGDADALAQVLVNLLSNAEKYSDKEKEITVEAARRDGPLPCAEVRISDRGLGVPRGNEEKIFQKFYRAHDLLSSGIQGSGLGLTLARQIARAHGGDVLYEPRDGGGSCFCLRLPLKMEAAPDSGS